MRPLPRRLLGLLATLVVTACGSGNQAQPDGGIVASPDAAGPPRCDLAVCQTDIARTCDSQPVSLDCTTFGASCADFVDPSNTAFSWCDCGPVVEGQGRCLDGRNGVTCSTGVGVPAQCTAGTRCTEDPTAQYGLTCACDDLADGICPDPACTGDPDCSSCTPSCAGKQCGDNGCGGQCGTCNLGETCTADQCTTVCVPDCAGKVCGDDGCGGTCGTCDGTCTAAGQCQGTCVPSCAGKTCGNDGCGGSCGSCSGGLSCTSSNACGCDFFATVKYTFTLDPAGTWPADFTFVGLNVQHIDLDGTQNPSNSNGAFLKLMPASAATFAFTVYGCRPDITIKRDYALSGVACHFEQTITDRTDFVIPAPVVNADGSCTAPTL